RRNKVTIAFCAPISLHMMMKQCSNLRDALQSLRFVVSAGETLPAPAARPWRVFTGTEVLAATGSTETLAYLFSRSRAVRVLERRERWFPVTRPSCSTRKACSRCRMGSQVCWRLKDPQVADTYALRISSKNTSGKDGIFLATYT